MSIQRRDRSTVPRPRVTWDDVKFAAELPLLWGAARMVPEPRWEALCYRLESIKARLGLFDPAPVARTAQRVLGPTSESFDATAFAIASAAGRSEHHLQILKSGTRGGWNAAPVLRGEAHLDAALAAGHGAVLWVAHFCFNALATKMALSAAGYPVSHLSRPEHGFSKSRLGIALFNGIRVRAELAHLAGRIVIDRERPMAATLAAQRLLRKNGIVSLTAGAWEGQRLATINLLGGTLRLAVGAPGLARLAGAALLPVFTVRGQPGDIIAVVIEPPLAIPAGADADAALAASAQQFGTLLDAYVRRYPREWRDWKSLAFPA